MPGERLRLMDLLNAAQISPSTFNNWRERGLTIPAVREGKYSYYPREALDRLLAIRNTLEANVTLADLRDRFDPLPDDE